MAGPSWENLDDFLATDDDGGFATTAVIHFQDGRVSDPVKVLFDDVYLNAQLGEYEADVSEPRISGKESDLRAVGKYDRVVVDGETFDVMTEAQLDGQGWAIVTLARQDASS